MIDGAYTLESTNERRQSDNLCDYCGAAKCFVKKRQTRTNKNEIGAAVAARKCIGFLPILNFQDAAGCEGDFNTCRLGLSWAARLGIGKEIILHQRDKLYGRAVVTDIHTGVFEKLAKTHGRYNHLAIAAARKGESLDLHQAMINGYGKNWFDPLKNCSFIYLSLLS